jgi:glycosyltransferase involved in cell wall biosynthesis
LLLKTWKLIREVYLLRKRYKEKGTRNKHVLPPTTYYLPPMHIAIDVTSANKPERTGVEWYTFHLIQNLKEVIPGEHQVILYSANQLQGDLMNLPSNWKSKVLNWKLPLGWNTFRLSWEMWRNKPDLLFVPANKLPLVISKNTVTAIHDIGADQVPNKYDPKVRKKVKKATRIAVKKATKIITISEFTKKELVTRHKVKKEKIVTVPLAADLTRYKKLTEKETYQVLSKHRLSRNYFFHIGRLESKKNISTLIRAFDMFKKQRGVGDPFHLVLAGSPGFGYSRIKQFIDASPYKDQIHLLGRVPEEDVPALMNAATLYLFPSWYEGFGIPALETMACGTPMIASDIGALREVAGQAATFVSPSEPERWVKAMQELVSNGMKREELEQAGLERVKQFSWKRTAEETWEVFKKLEKRNQKSETNNKSEMKNDPNFLDV